jgi:shikimate kinase/3-dehydroquinate synthase
MQPGDSSHLILTGFMGTGKTCVGREVARQLGRPLVDMDAEIERRAGKSIPAIFAEEGQAAFRRMEAALCEELSTQGGLVIATGGGTLVDRVNRALMMRSGTVVCLTCQVDELLQRVGVTDERLGTGILDRPLLDTPDPRVEARRLLAERREGYAAIPWQIDTTHLSVGEVTRRVVALAETITLPVRHPEGEYPVHIGAGLLAHVGGALRATGVPEGGRVALVSNPVVMPLYGAQVETALRSAGLGPFPCTVPDGEAHKTLAAVASLYDQFLAGHLDRGDTVLALGGGVTGDLAGFAAASFMRGVRFAQVPTTLLAMVDASVGGKTGVDLPQGKNLVGAFKQPAVVLIDPAVLGTLPAEEFRSGLAEMVKGSVIGDPELFAALAGATNGGITHQLIARALRVKIDIVEGDPLEGGQRAVLNLGHTVGHALEQLSRFSLRHGEAVAIGMVAAARIAAGLDQAEPSLADRIAAVLKAWGLPVRCPPFDIDAIWEAMVYDKKRRGGQLVWVLPQAIGRVTLTPDVPRPVVESVLVDMGGRRDK